MKKFLSLALVAGLAMVSVPVVAAGGSAEAPKAPEVPAETPKAPAETPKAPAETPKPETPVKGSWMPEFKTPEMMKTPKFWIIAAASVGVCGLSYYAGLVSKMKSYFGYGSQDSDDEEAEA